MKSIKKIILTTIFCLSFGIINAQLVTNNTKTPEELVRDVLAGEGVQIFNVTFTGFPRQRGEFSGGNIGLNNGIILSTGTVLDEQNASGMKLGPVGPNNNSGGTSIQYTPVIRDQDLANLAGRPLSQTFDVAFIETGAYDNDWADIHMTPEQSVQAHVDVKGQVMVPVHNGTFDLA